MSSEEDDVLECNDYGRTTESDSVISVAVIEMWISDIVSDIPKPKVDELCTKILELGPSAKEDLLFITEDRIKGVMSELRTARLVRDLKELVSSEPSSSRSRAGTRRGNHSAFNTSTHKFDFALLKGNLLAELQKKERLPPPLLRELVRTVGQFCKNTRPDNMHMTHYVDGITLEICKKYSAALMDMCGGKVVGKGNGILNEKTYTWIENQRTPRTLDSLENLPKRRKLGKNRKLPNYAPTVDNLKAYENAKDVLKVTFAKPCDTWDASVIRTLLAESYPLQRSDINNADLSDSSSQCLAKKLCLEWPFLFHPIGASIHFTAGSDRNPNSCLDEFLSTDVTNIRYFLIHVCGAKAGKIDVEMQKYRLFVRGCGNGDTRSLYLLTVLDMLTVYFEEDMRELVVMVKENIHIPTKGYSFANDSGVRVPVTPCMVGKATARGSSHLACWEFFIFVDSVQVGGPYSALQAMKVIMPTYFMLSICYSNKLANTLEFYEKVVLGLNIFEIASRKVRKAIQDFEEFKKAMKS